MNLAQRLEDAHAGRCVRYAQAQQRLRPADLYGMISVAGGVAIYAGPDCVVNNAIGLGLSGALAAADLDIVEAFFQERGAPPRVDLCPHADPSLGELLRRRGYRVDFAQNMLYISLRTRMNADFGASAGPVQVTRAQPDEAALWIRTVAQGFTGADDPPQADLDILAPNFYAADSQCFFAWLDGQPAGGGGLYLHNGVAEFGGASTRPAFRKRGVQTALLNHRLAAARAAGCDLAMVMSSSGAVTQRNAERVGFRLAYTRAVWVKFPDEIRSRAEQAQAWE